MSYEIIKRIEINHKTKEVWITSCSNNVCPKIPKKWHCTNLSDYYKENGLKELEKELLYQFMAGNMQKGTSDYVKSIACYGKPESGNELIDYGYDRERAYSNLLLYRAEKRVKGKIKIGNSFFTKLTPRRAFFNESGARAKTFTLADFHAIKKRFSAYNLTFERM
jgi:hypothetical protein